MHGYYSKYIQNNFLIQFSNYEFMLKIYLMIMWMNSVYSNVALHKSNILTNVNQSKHTS